MRQLQHLVMGTDECSFKAKCSFLHADLNMLDRSEARTAATKVVVHSGRLAALLAKLSDVSIKFLGD